jgi:hypothetical protein
MRIGRASHESNNDNDPILNSAGEPFSIRMYSFHEDRQLVGWEHDPSKALMMFHENNFPPTHDLMDKMRTEGPSAPDGPPNESEQNMIDTLDKMMITPEKQRLIQRTFNSIHDRHARIIGCCVCGIRCILPTVTEGAPIPPPVLKVFPTDPLFGPLKFDDEQMREWHLLDTIKQKVMSSNFSDSDGNRYHVHQELINLIQVMDGGDDDFSLIMKGYICTKCENYLSQKNLPMYSGAMCRYRTRSFYLSEDSLCL